MSDVYATAVFGEDGEVNIKFVEVGMVRSEGISVFDLVRPK
jgi:hypothetical protein